MRRHFNAKVSLALLGLAVGIGLHGCGILEEEETSTSTGSSSVASTDDSTSDTTAPTIIFTVPATADSDFAVNDSLQIVFSEAMKSSTVDNTTITLTQANGSTVASSVSLDNSTAQIVTLDPSADLAYDTSYILAVSADVTDDAGNAVAAENFIFTTTSAPDTSSPAVSSVDPDNNATGVAITSAVTITFDEDMDLDNVSGAISLANGGTNVPGEVTFSSGSVAIFTASNPLELDTTYTLTITSAADSAGNVLSSYTSNFTTTSYTALARVKQLSAGTNFTCALLTTGTVECWGENSFGKLGNGSNSDSEFPVTVTGLEYVQEISSGADHTCTVLNDRTVKCWGANSLGQLGDGSGISSTIVTTADSIDNATSVSNGYAHSCALLDGGSIKCWGSDRFNQLGDDASAVDQSTPVAVAGLDNMTSVSAGGSALGSHTCAIHDNNSVSCWGDNGQGQIGDNTTTTATSPTLVSGSGTTDNYTMLALGGLHTCGLLDNGSVKCWGDAFSGQLGDNGTTDNKTPTLVVGLTNAITDIAAGEGHTCALDNTSEVYCWGANSEGQLGDNSTTNSSVPKNVVNLDNVSSITAGRYHTCAVLDDDNATAMCWGDNSNGQLGDSTKSDSKVPVQVFTNVSN